MGSYSAGGDGRSGDCAVGSARDTSTPLGLGALALVAIAAIGRWPLKPPRPLAPTGAISAR